jgi:hypothetical protein
MLQQILISSQEALLAAHAVTYDTGPNEHYYQDAKEFYVDASSAWRFTVPAPDNGRSK